MRTCVNTVGRYMYACVRRFLPFIDQNIYEMTRFCVNVISFTGNSDKWRHYPSKYTETNNILPAKLPST